MSTNKKLILVIGATGAQGLVVVDALLAPASDGSPSPYAVRALTRDPESRRAKELSAKGVELAIGRFDDFAAVRSALQDCWGAFINTDGFTVGEERETYAAMRIFELAKQTSSLRHYVWSNLDYVFKKGGYKDEYRAGHYDGKGRIAEWLKAQPTSTDPEEFMWSVLTTGPYMDMLHFGMFGPRAIRKDGTREFIAPVGQGHVPMISLVDLGWWARYTFDAPRELVSGQDLEVAGEMVSWADLVATFTRVSGLPAVYIPVTIDQWMDATPDTNRPVAADHIRAGRTDVTTFRENFSGFWRGFRDDVIKRDMQWIRRVHPGVRSLEDWMRENKYTGETKIDVLKGVEEGARALWKKVAEESKL